jgi:hypothetical protein
MMGNCHGYRSVFKTMILYCQQQKKFRSSLGRWGYTEYIKELSNNTAIKTGKELQLQVRLLVSIRSSTTAYHSMNPNLILQFSFL